MKNLPSRLRPLIVLLAMATNCEQLPAAESLLPYSGAGATSVVPTTAEKTTNSLSQDGSVYVFSCKGEKETTEYIFNPQLGLLGGLRIRRDGDMIESPFSFRATIAPEQKEVSELDKARQAADETTDVRKLQKKSASVTAKGRFLDARIEGDALVANYEYSSPDGKISSSLKAELRAIGKTLELKLSAAQPIFDSVEVATKGKPIPNENQIGDSYRIGENLFASAFPDLWQSDSAELRSNAAMYLPLTDGTRLPVRDTFYLTVSSSYPETLANSKWPASPYMKEFETRVVSDMFEGDFASHLDLLKQLKPYSVDRLLVILHYWQNLGFDRSNPDMMPAYKALGGNEGLRALSQGAHQLGHRFCIHENYLDVSAPFVKEYKDYLAKRPDGSYVPHAGGNMFFVKPSRHLELVKDRAAAATKAFDLDATFHDVMPHWKVDFDAAAPNAGNFRLAALEEKKYFQAMRDERKGPMITEMLGPSLSGLWDGGCNAYTDNMRNRKLLPIAELLKVQTKQSNHGIGYYERWLPWGSKPGWDTYKPTDRELDRYRCMQIGFGRVGFIGRQLNNYTPHIHAIVREYHLMRAFGAGYVNRKIESLEYLTPEGKWVGPLEAAESGQWQRLRATWEGGHKVWINYTAQPWNIDGLNLPAWGSAIRGPRGRAGTELRDGQITDYCEYEDIIYADARSHTWIPLEDKGPIVPELGAWKDHGDGSFDLEVIWKPQRTLSDGFNAFWLFRDEGSATSRPVFHNIAVPGDKPTSAWEAGQTYSDKRLIRIPSKDQRTGTINKTVNYDIVVGLTHPAAAKMRPVLKDHLNQIRVATMKVEKTGDKITSVKIEPADQPPPPGVDPAPYREGLNAEKKVIDFGKVATNGAVVIRQTNAGREIVPVPKGESMRVGLSGEVDEVLVYRTGEDQPDVLKTEKVGEKIFFDVPENAERIVVKEKKS